MSGVINGTIVRLYEDGEEIAYATSTTMEESAEERDTLSKDSVSSYRNFEIGQLSGSISCEALLSEDTTVGGNPRKTYYTLRTKFRAKTAISWTLTSAVTGDVEDSGSGYITAISQSLPVEENATFSFTIGINGAPTVGTVS